MKTPTDPTPYIEFIEESLCVMGYDWLDAANGGDVAEALAEEGLDPEMSAWVYDYVATHPYEIKVVWGDVPDQ
jgi:hypothetical protein